jgi:peroxiredoxin
MKPLLAGLIACAIVAAPALAALKEGETAPDFAAPAALAGKEFRFALKDALRKGPVVVYFYPSAYTGGCNVQAHTFAVKQAQFTAAGASIVGVSLDSIARLRDFSADPEYCAGKIPVASDADGRIAKSYDLKVADARPGFKDTRGVEIDHGFAERTTFVVTPDGRIAATIGGMKPADNVDAALAAVTRMAATPLAPAATSR